MQTTPLDPEDFGKRVRTHRTRMTITETQFAQQLGISRSQVNHIENGRHWPSVEVYVKICDALNLRVPPLFEKAA